MASSFLFEEASNLPSCPGDKAHVSAAEQTLAAGCAASLPRSPEVVLLKHLVSSILSPASEMQAFL